MTDNSAYARSPCWPGAFGPLEGESPFSWLETLAQKYGFDSAKSLLGEAPVNWVGRLPDLDREWPASLGRRVESATGLQPGSMAARRSNGPEWLLPSDNRVAVCPLCLLDDIGARRRPFRRLAWGGVLSLVCHTHAFPLLDLPKIPKRPAQLVRLAEPFMMKAIAGAGGMSPVVSALQQAETFFGGRAGKKPSRPRWQIVADVMWALNHAFGGWLKESAHHQVLHLYAIQREGTLAYNLLFDTHFREREPREVSADARFRFERIRSVGYRRQLLYSALDLLAMIAAGDLNFESAISDECYSEFFERLDQWKPGTLKTVCDFAAQVIPIDYQNSDFDKSSRELDEIPGCRSR